MERVRGVYPYQIITYSSLNSSLTGKKGSSSETMSSTWSPAVCGVLNGLGRLSITNVHCLDCQLLIYICITVSSLENKKLLC